MGLLGDLLGLQLLDGIQLGLFLGTGRVRLGYRLGGLLFQRANPHRQGFLASAGVLGFRVGFLGPDNHLILGLGRGIRHQQTHPHFVQRYRIKQQRPHRNTELAAAIGLARYLPDGHLGFVNQLLSGLDLFLQVRLLGARHVQTVLHGLVFILGLGQFVLGLGQFRLGLRDGGISTLQLHRQVHHVGLHPFEGGFEFGLLGGGGPLHLFQFLGFRIGGVVSQGQTGGNTDRQGRPRHHRGAPRSFPNSRHPIHLYLLPTDTRTSTPKTEPRTSAHETIAGPKT